MQIRVLGPLEVETDGGERLELPVVQARLITLLVISANKVVSVDRLADELWAGSPPATAVTTLRAHMSRLRQALGEDNRIATRLSGYALRLDRTESDALLFEDAAARGRALVARNDHRGGVEAFSQALSLWRGDAFVELADSQWAQAEASRLGEARLGVMEDRVEAELASGNQAALAAELDALCIVHPLRERLWAARMVALYRSGRQSDALRAYQALRSRLGEELGIEPSPELTRLEARILAQDPTLAAPSAVPGGDDTASGVQGGGDATAGLPSGVVTFLLTDIVGSTEAWEADPDSMALALAHHDAMVDEVVSAGGGVVIKTKGEGDATLSVFLRASAAAATAAGLQRAWRAQIWPGSLALSVRVALHTGEAHERAGDYFGPAVNRAARIRSEAMGGQILLSAATAGLVADRPPEGTTLFNLGRRSLRGMSRPEDLYVLRGEGLEPAHADPDRDTAQSPTGQGVLTGQRVSLELGADTGGPGATPIRAFQAERDRPSLPAALGGLALGPFVGRDAEMARLRAAWTEAKAGDRRAVLVAGEPGVGKSRLAAEVARHAYEDGAIVLYGRCDPEGAVVYQPFIEALRALLDPLDAVQISEVLGPQAPALSLFLPELGFDGARPGLGGMAVPGRGDAPTERHWAFDALARILERLAEQASVLVVADDLHWASGATLGLLSHLLRRVSAGRVLILGTYRDTELDRSHPLAEALPELRAETGVDRLAVRGLSAPAVVDYLQAAANEELDTRGLELAAALHEETQGNPLFVGEVLAHLLETGAIFQGPDGRWTAAEGVTPASLGLPEGVREVIGRRLSRLSEAANRALGVAAVIGPTFSFGLIEAVTGADCLDALDEAMGAGLVREEPPGFAFSHALVRQVVYGELSSARRARLHRQVGEALEARPEHERNPAILFHHFAAGALDGGAPRALDCALAAAEQASAHMAFREANAIIEQALQLQEVTLPGQRRLRAELLILRAGSDAIGRPGPGELGDRVDHFAGDTEAAAIARELGDPELLARVGEAVAQIGDLGRFDPEVELLCREALAGLGEGHEALRARVLSALGQYLAWNGLGVGARAVAEEAIELARASGDQATLGEALSRAGFTLAGSGRPEEQIALMDEIIVLARRPRNGAAMWGAYETRSSARLELGDLEGAKADWVKAQAILAELGAPDTRSYTEVTLALVEGHFELAARMADEFIATGWTGRPDPVSELVYAGQQFVLHREAGRLGDLLPILEGHAADNPGVGAMRAIAILAQLEAGDADTARAGFEEVATAGFGASHPQDQLWTLWLSLLSEVCAVFGDVRRAGELGDLLGAHAGHVVCAGQGACCFGSVDRFLGMLAATQGHDEEAEARYRSALDLEERMGAPPFAARTRYWYARFLLGRGGPGDRAQGEQLLSEAIGRAEELGMKRLAADARVLLDGRASR